VGATVAYLGLKTWRRELRGRAEYDLARRILSNAYKVRRAIHTFRAVIAFEEPDPLTKLKRINEHAAELDAAFIEAKVLWQDRLDEPRLAMKGCLDDIIWSADKKRAQAERKPLPLDKIAKADAILWGTPGDEFAQRVENTVKLLEDTLRSVLGR